MSVRVRVSVSVSVHTEASVSGGWAAIARHQTPTYRNTTHHTLFLASRGPKEEKKNKGKKKGLIIANKNSSSIDLPPHSDIAAIPGLRHHAEV